MRHVTIAWLLIVALAIDSQSQTNPSSVTEPPEFSGPPKEWTPPTDLEKQLGEIAMIDQKDGEKVKAGREKLDSLLDQHPDLSDARILRVTEDLCLLNSKDYDSMLKDYDALLEIPNSEKPDTQLKDRADWYSMRAKIKFMTGQYGAAMSDLDAAINTDPDSAETIWGSGAVDPEAHSTSCAWSNAEFDELSRRFADDYRIHIYRGLYLFFFTTFKEDSYAPATQEFQKAIALDPKSPLGFYFLGQLYMKSSFLTIAAARSDLVRNEAMRKAIQQYTLAIEKNPKFLPAYQGRAEAYLELKQSQQAINDYNVVLAREPDNATEHNDRGLAEMDLGRYVAATSDFGDALRIKQGNDFESAQTYENRADAYIKEGEYTDAVEDLTKAIGSRVGQESILLDIRTFRILYPEFDRMSDEVVCRKLRDLYWPSLTYDDYSEMLLHKNHDHEPSFLLADLYVKRGDTYLQARQWRSAMADYRRAFEGFGDYGKSVDRWRSLGKNPSGEAFVDARTAEFPPDGSRKLWLKTVKKNSTFEVDAYEINCSSREIALSSTVEYDANDKVVSSVDGTGAWQSIIPDSIGEGLYDGMCSGR
jgi:tetratricopeptide (TPR) repeat protein